ncbi:tRNA (guanosine(46)-N7)-methyltransferase TrmB [Mycoplasmopsis columbina]|uniref:tRNA (guanosine(46)-N7)-methyltransferase TrmB n=1 Tax=Mycoplasmopsis columbina TaxID=114881 RepID=UPI0004A6AEBE|nr:tRNA (guanosine(46)-N7)-methyltransferase TrmB [Mycoplasmopsis columbina]VEU76633.1 tRNA (guanine-N(7)-)-methyltransferase [Mycoplasmopsis columbina]
MRLRFDKTAEEKIINSSFYVSKDNYPILLNENTIIEIGMGKGEMIVELAKANPEIIFYGLEKYPTVAYKAVKKAQEYNLSNFKLIIDDATNLNEIFTGKTNTIWLTFSDPWPKARHEKRRLTYKTYLNLYKEILSDAGLLKFKSDNDKLYEFSLESFKENNWDLVDYGNDLHSSKWNKENIMTGYEKKWSSLGKNINFIFAKIKKSHN